MFARILAFDVKSDRKEEFVKALKDDVLPVIKQQVGFLEALPFFQKEGAVEKFCSISLWISQHDAEHYEKELYPQIVAILNSFAVSPVTVTYSSLETRLCDRFVDALAV